MQSIRIVAVDDHPIFRDGLRQLLEHEPDFQVVGVGGSAQEALRLVADLSPDVLLLDLSMPDGSGLEVLRALDDSEATVRTILLTASAGTSEMVEALRRGARGLVLKNSATALLYKCVRCVAAGEYWFGRDRMSTLIEAVRMLGAAESTKLPARTLTKREGHIVAAIVEGATNRDISAQLGVSEQTVKNHLSNIFDKVGVSNRLELALFAIHHKLLDRLR
jgi:DNA-binding NarL/FixJ family response regulator